MMAWLKESDVGGHEIKMQYEDDKNKMWILSYNAVNNRYHLWTKTKSQKKPVSETTSHDIEKLISMIPEYKNK